MPEKKYNQFRAMFAITKASFRSITRSPSAVVFTLIFPLIFILVFGFLGGNGISIDLGVTKHCDKNNPLYENMQRTGVFKMNEKLSDAEMKTDLEKGKIDALLTIEKNPAGSKTEYTAHLLTSSASPKNGNLAKNILDNVINKMNFTYAQIEHPVAELKQTEVPGRAYRSIDFILPGQLGFSLLSTGVFGTAFVFFSLRQTLVIKRFFATPIKRIYIVMGEALSRMVFAMLGAIFIITIGRFAFGFTLVHGFTTGLTMLLLSAMGLIVFMGFGFVVSGIAKNESTIPPLANIITLPQFLLSGTFFSIDNFPSWLQPICKVLPLTYLNDAMRKVAFEGATLFQISHQLLIIGIWGVAVYILAAKTFRWE